MADRPAPRLSGRTARRELTEHLSYWQDATKQRAYLAALREVVTPDSVVLDLGSGTGLLGMLALRAGARRVIAVEQGEIIGAARRIAERNGFADRVQFIRGHSSQVDLEPVDVAVCDQIGGLVHDAGVLRWFRDLVEREIVAPDRCIPGSFELFLAPVEAPGRYEAVTDWRQIADVDLEPMAVHAANTEYRVRPKHVETVAPGVCFDRRNAIDERPIGTRLEFVAERDAVVHGFLGWFSARLSPSVVVTNAPHAADRMHRWMNLYLIDPATPVRAGDRIAVDLSIRPDENLTSWRATIGDRQLEQQSTFLGSFRSAEGLGFGAAN